MASKIEPSEAMEGNRYIMKVVKLAKDIDIRTTMLTTVSKNEDKIIYYLLLDTGAAEGKQSRRHGEALGGLAPPNKAPRPHKLNYGAL